MGIPAAIVPSTGFNPRTRKGATGVAFLGQLFIIVSIHAPVRVRLRQVSQTKDFHRFNPRTRKGATSTTCHNRSSKA